MNSLEEIVAILMEMEKQSIEENPSNNQEQTCNNVKNDMTDTQCKQLLDDIDFNDPLEYCHSPNTSLVQKEEEKKQQKEQVPILAPFTSNEEKSAMCPAVSSSSVTSSDTFETQVCIFFSENHDTSVTFVS